MGMHPVCQCLLAYKPVRTGKAAMQTWNCQLPCLCQVEQLGLPTDRTRGRQKETPTNTFMCNSQCSPGPSNKQWSSFASCCSIFFQENQQTPAGLGGVYRARPSAGLDKGSQDHYWIHPRKPGAAFSGVNSKLGS